MSRTTRGALPIRSAAWYAPGPWLAVDDAAGVACRSAWNRGARDDLVNGQLKLVACVAGGVVGFASACSDRAHVGVPAPSLHPLSTVDAAPGDPVFTSCHVGSPDNPPRCVDPDGASVLVVGPARHGSRPQGHAAIWVSNHSGARGVSFRGRHGFAPEAGKRGKEKLIARYAADGRVVTEFRLKLAPDQEAKALEFMRANPEAGVERRSFDTKMNSNCVTAVGNVLEASGAVAVDANPGRRLIVDLPARLHEDLSRGGRHAHLVAEVIEHRPEDGRERGTR